MAVVFKVSPVPTASQINLSAYLLRDIVVDPIDALSPSSQSGGDEGMVEIEAAAGFATLQGSRAFLAANKETAPPWAIALSGAFPDIASVHNTSSRLVIFLPVRLRWFALCFGYGNAALRWGAIEPNFGLKFAARNMDSDDVMELGSRRIDASARTQVVQAPAGASLSDLDVPLLGEFVRRLSGKLDAGTPVEIDGVSTVVASDGISFKMGADLSSIAAVLEKMLDAVESSGSKPEFEFVDSLEPLRATDDRVEQLETAVAEVLDALVNGGGAPSTALISVAPPNEYSLDEVHQVRVAVGGEQFVLPDFSLDSLVGALRSAGRKITRHSLSGIRVALIDLQGNAQQSTSLKSWLVFETDVLGERFILTIGRWFALAVTFAAKLNADLAPLEDLTGELSLPAWNTATHKTEYAYNRTVEATGRFALVDHKTFTSEGSQIEPCDLFSMSGHFIHVKRWDQSATLSHLFAQGLVSLAVMNRDPSFATAFESFISTSAPHCAPGLTTTPRHVVYAIGVTGARPIPESLPTFSKVNLRDYIQRVRGAGAQVSIARIQMV